VSDPTTLRQIASYQLSWSSIDGCADTLRSTLKAESGADPAQVYCTSKFTHLLGAHHWRRALGEKATVVAVSPGMIPGTGLGRHMESPMSSSAPDAKDLPTGQYSILGK